MTKFMSPAELRALYEQWGALPGNGATLLLNVRQWICGKLAEVGPSLLLGAALPYALTLIPGQARDDLVEAAGDEAEAQRIWRAVIYQALRELIEAGWSVLPEPQETESWTVLYRVLGPCTLHGLSLDPVIGGCPACVAAMPLADDEEILLLQHRPDPEQVH